MKKARFVFGILLLLIGLSFVKPGEFRENWDGIENDELHDNTDEHINSTYDQAVDRLEDNVDIAAYGVAMVGIILIILSFVKKGKKDSGLLYQKEDVQNISPHHLEKSITNPAAAPPTAPPLIQNQPPMDPHGNAMGNPGGMPNGHMGPMVPVDDGLELPVLTMTTPGTTSGESGSPGMGGVVRRFDPKTGLPLKDESPDPDHPDTRVETVLSCPNCQQGFSLKGEIKEVICPRCGKRFEVAHK